ncbi:hypothetical protein [Devosia sediminis]|uniref:Uncharacterized protein n=1 Tax=Devosia sediminis TaxID=2798801 RepID=A0A934IY05_9HYPH|nr:hypothetical protein [Devosia sediminis]MBJ3784004.1 hypothetical protein [Devosia sediminis]
MGNKGNITTTEHDPHPSNEEHTHEQARPGGARPPRNDIGPNDAVHDGKPQRRPANVENGDAGR